MLEGFFHVHFSSFQISIRIFVPGAEHLCNFATIRGLHRQSTILHGTFGLIPKKKNLH